jgi:dinuclear metal center YbgI/SA1388 family protein
MERWAPSAYAYEWDSVGLHIGDPDATVTRVLTCLTPSAEALKAARKAKAEMVVAHHPLIFKPLKHLRSNSPQARLCLDFAEAGIACFCAHTNLDIVPAGVSHVLAARLGLTACQPLFAADHVPLLKLVVFVPESHLDLLRDAVSKAGAGVIGDYTHCTYSSPGRGTFLPGAGAAPYSGKVGEVSIARERRFETLVPEALLAPVLKAMRGVHPYEEPAYDLIPLKNTDARLGLGVRGELAEPLTPADFSARLRDALGTSSLRWVEGSKKHLRRVAVLGGSGGGDIARIPRDIDAYVTGDVKYHDADLARAKGLHVFDAGHVPTELPIVPAIADYLKSQIKALKATPWLEPDPFQLQP